MKIRLSKNKKVSIILCLFGFIGFAGLHKFYHGKWIMGIIYFCTVGFGFFGTLFDLIALLCGGGMWKNVSELSDSSMAFLASLD